MTTTPTTKRPVPKTAAQFRAASERMFRTGNSDCAGYATIEWEWTSRPYRGKGDPTHLFRTGYFIARAEGYRAARVMCNLDMTSGRMSVVPGGDPDSAIGRANGKPGAR